MKCVEVRGVKIGEGIPKIIVPIVGTTKREILEAASSIMENAPKGNALKEKCKDIPGKLASEGSSLTPKET